MQFLTKAPEEELAHTFQLKPTSYPEIWTKEQKKKSSNCIESVLNEDSGNNQLLGVGKKEEHLKNTKGRSVPVQSIWIVRNDVCSAVIVAK